MYQNNSEQMDKIIPALIKAQAMITGAVKDGVNPHFKSNYSTLESVINACKEPLNANDLMFTQSVNVDGERIILETKIYHSSGQWIASHCPLVTTKNDAQGYGSSLSYFKRYLLSSILGIAQKDDDGTEAVKPPPLTEEQSKEIEKLIGQDKQLYLKVQDFIKSVNAKSLKDVPQDQYSRLLMACKNYIENKGTQIAETMPNETV